MFDRTSFLTGVLACLVGTFPYLKWLERTPQIVAEPVSEDIYAATSHRQFSLTYKSFPLLGTTKTIHINIASYEVVNAESRKAGYDKSVAGFYDPSSSTIWCVNSVEVLIHELRHAFEGRYHR